MIKIDNANSWRYYAKCAGDEPSNYELDQHKLTETERHERARELCRGCLVIKDCASEALHPMAVGTVRAGVWITGRSGNPSYWLKPAKTLLKLIATGAINADQIHEANQVKLRD